MRPVFIKHVLLPLIVPLLLVVLFFTPKAIFGCSGRGLLALFIVFASEVGSLATTIKFIFEQRRRSGDVAPVWWLITSFILLLPVLLILGPLG